MRIIQNRLSGGTAMRIAIVHDYLNQYGGAERVLEALKELFPSADVFTLVYDKKSLPQYASWNIRTSFIARLPGACQHPQRYCWLFPLAFRFFPVRAYDRIIVATHAWGNSIARGEAPHITYCHTPVRYFWDLFDDYIRRRYVSWPMRVLMRCLKYPVRWYDRRCAKKVTLFIANSNEVKQRIHQCYGRAARVVYPPVKVDFFAAHVQLRREAYYLIVARLKPYKRIDIIIEAFNHMKKPLVVVGDGPEEKHLRSIAGPTVVFKKNISDEALRDLYSRARGYVYAAHEDFGMSMAEALAAGTPVIAYKKGGACEIVEENVTGIFYQEQSVAALADAVMAAEDRSWDHAVCSTRARRFSAERFNACLTEAVSGTEAV